ncbi:MAG: hypothetical protein FWD15_02360 [Alphaproteobacteria bacterium]|nr:hypothetical protein [Alphaproteobacteria bacterium]
MVKRNIHKENPRLDRGNPVKDITQIYTYGQLEERELGSIGIDFKLRL